MLYPDAAVEVSQAGEIPRGCFRARLRAGKPMAIPPA